MATRDVAEDHAGCWSATNTNINTDMLLKIKQVTGLDSAPVGRSSSKKRDDPPLFHQNTPPRMGKCETDCTYSGKLSHTVNVKETVL